VVFVSNCVSKADAESDEQGRVFIVTEKEEEQSGGERVLWREK